MKSCRKTNPIRWIAQVAILSAAAAVIMFLEFPIPFLGPFFLKFDFSEIPVLIGAFALGPLAGMAIEALKVVLNLLLDGSWSFGIGELANFLIGVAFVFPASLIYSLRKTKKNALLGLAVGVVTMATAGALLNLFLLLPVFAAAYGTTAEAIILSYSEAIPYIVDLPTGILLGIVPFNLFKGIVISILVMLLYKRVSPLIKGRDEEECDVESKE
ncbi:MAG TPA: ECF transporter S component [Candidatus Izemoplasmatales bacterium]|nr:ECF transporter S component [Bacillota bacterium]HRY77530.1 ECF transporter S component [Candidatus Izemoplasmatales bacterium]